MIYSISSEGFTESNHLFLFYISCRRLKYLINDFNLTENESDSQIYNEWRTISNEERQVYVNAYSQVRTTKRPLLSFALEKYIKFKL